MSRGERIGIWSLLALLTLGLIVGLALLYGEIADLRSEVELVAGTHGPRVTAAPPETTSPSAWDAPVEVTIADGTLLESAAVVTFTVRGSGVADPLQELPVLACGESRLPVEGASLEKARRDLLDLITAGEARTTLRFSGMPPADTDCTLVFNPGQDPQSAIAPRLERPVTFPSQP